MFSQLPEALSNFKDKIADEMTKKIAEQVRDITGGAVSIDSILKGQVSVDANSYVDKMLFKVSEKLESTGITEIELPKHTMPFEKDVMCGLVFPGEVDFHKGIISGVTTLGRMGEAALKINAFEDPIITVNADIGIKEALVNYLANIKFLCLNQDETKLSGGLKDIHLIVCLTVSRDFVVKMDQFEVKHTGSLTMEGLETLGFFEFVKDQMSDDLELTIKESVKKYLQSTIKNMTDDVVKNLPLTF